MVEVGDLLSEDKILEDCRTTVADLEGESVLHLDTDIICHDSLTIINLELGQSVSPGGFVCTSEKSC